MKPKISYAQFAAERRYQPGSIAALIERFIKEMNGTPENPGVRPLGDSHWVTLERIQDESISAIVAKNLDQRDVIAYCKWRREVMGVGAATVGHDMTCLRGVLKYAGAAWADCDGVSDKPIKKAKPFLTKHGLWGKSIPRTRRPQKEEKAQLHTRFDQQNRNPICVVDMVRVSRWQQASSRRIGESCALLWPDWNYEKQTILVRKMKDPKNRNKQKVVALPWDAQELLLEWAFEMNERPELRNDEPRILPYKSKTCTQRYTKAKKLLGIVDLHLHDDRRDRGSRLIEEDGLSAEEAIQFTGHENTNVFQRTYMVLDPAIAAEKARRIREQQSASTP